MKNLFILDGAAGTGKTDFVKYILNDYNRNRSGASAKYSATVVTKYTTRKKRKDEKEKKVLLDLNFVTDEQFNNLKKSIGENIFFSYEYGNYKYGVQKSDIDEALSHNQNVFIIIRSLNCIEKITMAYENKNINIIPIFIYTDENKVIDRLKKDGYNETDIKFRLERSKIALDDYKRHSQSYKHLLLNVSDETIYRLFIDQLLEKYNEEENERERDNYLYYPNGDSVKLYQELSGLKNNMLQWLEKHPYDKNIYLMIRYRDYNKSLTAYIKKNITAKGFNCVIADEVRGISDTVYNPIAVAYCCKYGIALFDEPKDEENAHSPSVAYELGIMDTLCRKSLVIRHKKLKDNNRYSFFDTNKNIWENYDDNMEILDIIDKWIETL